MIEEDEPPKGFSGLSKLAGKKRVDRTEGSSREADAPQPQVHSQPSPKPTPPARPQSQPQSTPRKPTEPAPAAGQRDAPASDGDSATVIVIASIAVVAGLVWLAAAISDKPVKRAYSSAGVQPSAVASSPTQRTEPTPQVWAYVTSLNANVRSGSGTSHGVIGSLPQMSRVEILGEEGNWSKVRVELASGSANGYMSHSVLRKGTYADAREIVCDVQNSIRPRSGEVLLQRRYGDHHLTVNAGEEDTLVKLRQGQTTVLSFYVRRGETGVVRTVPEGRYQVMFATGDGFSRKCLEFVRSMQVLSDPGLQAFETTSDGFSTFLTTSTYTLTRQVGGNFSPQTVDGSAFRESSQ